MAGEAAGTGETSLIYGITRGILNPLRATMDKLNQAKKAAEHLGSATGGHLNDAYGSAFSAVLEGGLKRKGVPRDAEGVIAVAIANEVARARREAIWGSVVWNMRIFCSLAASWIVLLKPSPWAIAIPAMLALMFSPVITLRDVR